LTPELFRVNLNAGTQVLFFRILEGGSLAMADERVPGPHSRRTFLRFGFAAAGGVAAATHF
jgi:hypothetical protein